MDPYVSQQIPIDVKNRRISWKDIIQATNNFAEDNIIEKDYCQIVYKGELSGKNLAFIFANEGYMLSYLPEHQNIVPFIGCCEMHGKMILVFEHPTHGSLDKHVTSAHLTWLMRVKICLDIASGLHYLQTREMVIGDLHSGRIHLDENWRAKIQLIEPSTLMNTIVESSMAATYDEEGRESEKYPFGVILFELLCARLAVTNDEEEGTQFLSNLACCHYEKGTLTELVDPVLRVQMNRDSFTVFTELAYACLGHEPPTFTTVVEELQKVLKLQQGFETPEIQQIKSIQLMKIQLEDIRLATCDFHDDYTIPRGTGKVYKADLYHFNVDKYVAENKIKRVSMKEIFEYPKRKSTVAIKSIDGGYGQRTEEQLQTLLYLSHENLVKLVGFCDDDDERIHVVYDYASNGSLSEYIERQHINFQKYSTNSNRGTMRNIFPWVIRLQFCLDAARGLNFLHNGNGKNDPIIHGNVKSSNILISRDGVGMIGDFGLSTNQNTHRLTKEFDVFSFGLVLYEVMSKDQLTHFELSKDDQELLPDIVKLGFNQRKLNDIIHPMLQKEFEKDHASGSTLDDSIDIFSKIAYRCFEEVENRPTMADIVKELEKAYEYHVEGLEKRQNDEDNSKMENLKHLKIPFKEIYSATHGFDDSSLISWGGFGGVFRAELFHVDVRKYVGKKESLAELYGYPRRKGKVHLKRREITSDQGREHFWKEIDMLSGLNHQNLTSLVGFCYEYGEMIIVYDYASNGSFDRYIQNNQNLKWEQRLQICIDAAQGLNYLHNRHIIHCDVKSDNILLGDSLEGIIGDVGLSFTTNSVFSQLIVDAGVGTPGYIDPEYLKRGILTKQSNMYSFGVVLLEVLCGRFVKPPAKDKLRANLVEMAEQYLTSNQPYQIIGDYLRKDLVEEKFLDSVKTFGAITHECLHSTDGDETHRLTMADVLKELKKALTVYLIGSNIHIGIFEINSATNYFSKERVIGSGASGMIYKGELSFSKKSIPVAVKRLDRAHSYKEGAFLNQVAKLSRYVHENIITLRGFCEEDDEKIIIMNHASNESLDKHLDKSILTWGIRLKISIGAAKGLNHIHSFKEDQKTVHGDIKSSNILLDHDWKAKISDFIVSKSHGTLGYLDPQYSGAAKEADVYSFGIVLFELLSGRLAIDKVEKYSHPTLRQIIDAGNGVNDKKVVFLASIAARCFEEKKLDALIFDDIKEQTDAKSIDIFSQVAYECLQKDQAKRPSMGSVIKELQRALNVHVKKRIQHMNIPLKEIQSATSGITIPVKTGKMYKADLSHFDVDKYFAENKIKRVSMEQISGYPRIKSTVVIKSIDGGYGPQTEERLQTLLYLSHVNLVKLVGFCDEDDKRIHVVYEYASNGSLDDYIRRQHIIYQNYITNPTRVTLRNIFPWVIRLQFCLDAALGLRFLHNGDGKNSTIIHGNIKSSNILIGRDGVGMIGDFVLSTNQNKHRLTKEYDVFSFGLVLYEVMSKYQLTNFDLSKDDPELLPDQVKRGSNQRKLNDIIDPMLKKEFEKDHASSSTLEDSIDIFAKIAYRCLEEVENRPTMADVVKELKKAYEYHVKSLEKRQNDEDNSKVENLKHLKIPFKEIYSATHGFNDSCMIGCGGFGGVYKAELFHVDVRKYVGKKESLVEPNGYPRRKGEVALKRREIESGQGRNEFWKEIDVLSPLNHQNIISLVGFCYEYGEMIIIYDYASNGSFRDHIPNKQRKYKLNWAQRLQICIDVAQGLNYLHNNQIIHRDVKSDNILLGSNWEGIIGDVGMSITINKADSQISNINPAGTYGYVDPVYLERRILTKQSDIYSFGVVMLELLCGKFVKSPVEGSYRASLVDAAEQHLAGNQPYQIMAHYLKEELRDKKCRDSVKTFSSITHECLHSSENQRLTMADVLKALKKALSFHLIGSETISLEEIKSATNHFSKERLIGSGASGKIYKGELTFAKKSVPVAVKRLDRARSSEEGAFLKEVVKLSRYVHENIITLRGFCEEDNENFIIMDYASNESLDRHLDKSILTWGVRLKISIGAAKGLKHIHSFEEDQKTVHGDIKSSNILLDHDWKASITDFIVSESHGTLGYRDPEYSSSGATKEADVYSFGVVLFELLSGKLAIDKVEKYSHPTLRQIIDAGAGVKDKKDAGDGVKDKKSVFLAWMAARCFEDKKLEALIFDDVKEQTDAKSIDILSEVAYACLQKDKKERPTMALVIQELEKALNIHVDWEFEQKLPKDNENIMKMIEHRESKEITKKDLYPIFSSGIRPNNGNVWLSLNKDGKVKEMISATMFSYEKCWSSKWKDIENSRFGTVAKISNTPNLKISIKIKTQFLSLGNIYGAYLVFKFCDPKVVSSKPYVDLKYKTASGELNSYIAERRDGDWMIIELCRFRSDNQIIDFEVQLESFCGHPCGNGPIFIDGIEFRPIDNAAHKVSVGRLMNAESSANQDQQSPSDFQEIMKRSRYYVPTMSNQEIDKLLSAGVLIDNGEKLFWLSKVNCKKCHMLPAKVVINKSPDAKSTKRPSSTMSRFEEVVELQRHQAFSINCNIESKLLSPDTAYACYLVFQLPENSEGLKCPVKARDLLNKNNKESTIIYLKAPEPVALYRDKRVPDRREDGWMEVRVWEFVYNNEIKDIPMELKLACLGGTMMGLTICGIEFRP